MTMAKAGHQGGSKTRQEYERTAPPSGGGAPTTPPQQARHPLPSKTFDCSQFTINNSNPNLIQNTNNRHALCESTTIRSLLKN